MEEDSEQTSNEATLSYLDYLANLDSEHVRQEVAKRSAATKEHTKKLLHYVEMSGPIKSTPASTEEIESTNEDIDIVGDGSQGIINFISYNCIAAGVSLEAGYRQYTATCLSEICLSPLETLP